jgi:hypothetical protein
MPALQRAFKPSASSAGFVPCRKLRVGMNLRAQPLSMPYAPAAPVLGIVRRVREKGLPDHLSTSSLKELGIAAGNADRVLRALQFLGLVDEDERQTDVFKQLGRTRDAEYPRFLAEVIHRAYSAVFAEVDPATDGGLKLHNAFRPYEPGGQRSRMVSLFAALCREAAILPGGPVGSRLRARSAPRVREYDSIHPAASNDGAASQEPVSIDKELVLAVLARLPASGRWTRQQREKWIAAVAAAVDLTIEVEDQ